MMTGGRGLEAVATRRDFVTCSTCGGAGFGEELAGDPSIPYGVERITVRCETCGGSGEEYVGPSPEPEDYVEDDAP